MIRNFNEIKEKTITTDVLIIGAGTTGLYLAERLAEKFKKIIVVEKGGLNTKKINNKIKNFKGIFHYGFQKNIAIGLGGSSTLWGGQLVEFDKEDFSKKTYWGFDYPEIKFFYNKIYSFFKIRRINDKEFLNFTKEKKLNYKNITKFYTHWLNEPNFKRFFENKKLQNKVDIIINSEATKANFENKNCKLIEITSGDMKKIIKPKIVILSNGIFNATKFLLNQNNSPWKKNKLIGKFFQDHIGLFVGKIRLIDAKKFRNLFLNGFIKGTKYQPKIKSRYILNNFNYGISGEFKIPLQYNVNIINKIIKKFLIKKNFINFLSLFKILIYIDFFLFKKIIYFLINKKLLFEDNKDIFFYIQCEQRPNIKSKIYLKSAKKNKIDLNWTINGEEFNVIKKFVKDANNFLKNNKIAEIDTNKFSKLNYEKFIKSIRDTNHPSGGLIISDSNKKGVVDKNLRIWNTSNVYIAGPGVLPKTSHANVTFTSLALAERLVKYLRNKNV